VNKNKELCIDYTFYQTLIPDGYREKNGSRLSDPHEIRAFIPGTIIAVKVRKGQQVTAGQGILILEAMKMHNDVITEVTGKVAEVNVSPGDNVEKNQVMVRIEK
jgi:biotin carboxyl carrier protein